MTPKAHIEKLPSRRMMHLGSLGLVDVEGFLHQYAYDDRLYDRDNTIPIRQWLLDNVGHSGRDWMIDRRGSYDVVYYIFKPEDAFMFMMRWC